MAVAVSTDLSPPRWLPYAAIGVAVFALLTRAGLATSNSEARRLIKGGGCRINDVAVTDEKAEVNLAALDDDGVIKLSAGKKRHVLVRPL